jgi:hypothetical protein
MFRRSLLHLQHVPLIFKIPITRPRGFTQPLTEMSTRNIKKKMFLGSNVRRVRKADNLTAIYEPTVYTMWNP